MAGQKRHARGYVSAAVLAIAGGLLLGACSAGEQLEAMDPNLNLLEFETRQIACRFVDIEGFPVEAARVRFNLIGHGNGAVLDTRVAVTDAQGVARVNLRTELASTFKVECDSDTADQKADTLVTVARDNGGRLEVQVYPNAAAATIESELTLVDNFECAFLNPYQPPPATTHADERRTKQVVQLAGGGTPVTFAGLKPDLTYAVVAIGRANNQTVARGCLDKLTVNQTMIDQNRAVSVSMYLEDFLPDITGDRNSLELTTSFNIPLGLTSIGGLFSRMSDGDNDPADYILSEMAVRSDGTLQMVVNAYRTQVSQMLANGESARTGRINLRTTAKALKELKNIKLHTTMALEDEGGSGGNTQAQLSVTHKFSHFEAEVAGRTDKYTFRANQRIFPQSTPPVLEGQTTMNVEDASRVSFEPHRMSLPVGDAIVSRLLLDTFGDYRLERIITTMIECNRIGDMLDQLYQGMSVGSTGGFGWIGPIISFGIRIAATEVCQHVVDDIVKDISVQMLRDLKDARLDENVTFEGSANVQMRADGTTIDRLINGNWIGIGDFHARRR